MEAIAAHARIAAAVLAALTLAAGCDARIDSPAGIAVRPSSAALEPGGQQLFAATAGGLSLAVDWSVAEGPSGGSVSAAGLYASTSTLGTFHVVATSRADSTKTGSAVVTVTPPIGIPPGARVLYTADRTHSPVPAELATWLRSIAAQAAGNRPDVFMKVGDSITWSVDFAHCFDPASTDSVTWGAYGVLQPARDYFLATKADGTRSSFIRDSLAAEAGTQADWAITGSPAPLQSEADAVRPQIALVEYGTNEIGMVGFGGTLEASLAAYEHGMRTIVDRLIARGVVPVVMSQPPRTDSAALGMLVPAMTAVARGLAQGRQVPFADFFREIDPLPGHGMDADGVHPSTSVGNNCNFSAANLGSAKGGFPVRNLVALQALDRMRQVLAGGASSLDAAPPRLAGDGSPAQPFLADRLPFTDMRDSRTTGASAMTTYSCAGAPSQPGREVVYRLVLGQTTPLRIFVLDAGAGGVRVNLLDAGGQPSGCLKSASRLIATSLPAGTYHVVVDSPTAAGGAEYLLAVVECAAGDAACR